MSVANILLSHHIVHDAASGSKRMLRDVKESGISGIGGENDEDVPELMRSSKKVKAAREESFREARDVEDDSKRVEGVREEDLVE